MSSSEIPGSVKCSVPSEETRRHLPGGAKRQPPAHSVGGDASITARFARLEDAELIAEMAALVNIHNYAQFDRGFLFYSLSESEYRARIERGDICYLLEYEQNPIGFILAVPSALMQEHGEVNPLMRVIRDYASRHGIEQFLFVDQAAILPEFQNQGLGERHFEQLAARLPGPYFCDILESPLRNPRVRYWMKRGFRKIGEVVEPAPERFLRAESTIKKHDVLTWGVYFLKSDGWRVGRS